MTLSRVRTTAQISIRMRLNAALVAVVAFLVLAVGLSAGLQIDSAEQASSSEAEYVALALAAGIDESDLAHPEELLRAIQVLQSSDDRALAIVDGQRRIVARTASDPRDDEVAEDPKGAIHSALEGGETSHFAVEEAGANRRFIAAPIKIRDAGATKIIGAVVYDYSRAYAKQMAVAHAAITSLLAAFIPIILIVVLFGYQLKRSIMHPLTQLRGGVAAIAAEDLTARVPEVRRDEIGDLAVAFNHMAQSLQEGRSTLLKRMEKERLDAEKIEYLAFHDTLTGLANRAHFSARLTASLALAKQTDSSLVVVFIDLDRFKHINDSLGHDVGDTFLQSVAERLKVTVRDGDLVARLGGDEFVVVLKPPAALPAGQSLAGRILSALARPIKVAGHELRASASIGISVFPEHGQDEQTLMKNADIAMYGAKDRGRGMAMAFNEGLEKHSFERLAMESSLRQALENDEFEVHYQPKLDFRSGRITGMEALIRWIHPQLGMISPTQFIPIAEESGLIEPIGRWVLLQACQQAMQWRDKFGERLTVAVNLSARQFNSLSLLADIESILDLTRMDGSLLELEITESTIMANTAKALEVLTALKRRGIQIAIDDFGTGYSSLSSLKTFPIDTLKIDRSFVRGLPAGQDDRGITEAIIGMAKTLKLHLVAEGVETEAQAAFLRDHRCDEYQGFLFSKPLPPSEFKSLIHQHLSAATN